MRLVMVAGLALGIATAAHAQTFVNGYTRSNGTYVAPHYRSTADGIAANNWSTAGNVNPYTGAVGTRALPALPNYSIGLPDPQDAALKNLDVATRMYQLEQMAKQNAASGMTAAEWAKYSAPVVPDPAYVHPPRRRKPWWRFWR